MLFVESRVSDREVERGARLGVLNTLREKGFVPLIREARLHCFEQSLPDGARAGDLERAVAEWSDAEGDAPYVRGDLFCFDDYALFLVFGEADEGARGLRAGVVYTAETDAPAQKLEAFCREVGRAVEAAGLPPGVEWQERERAGRDVFARFAAAGETDAAPAQTPARGPDPAARARAVELLEDAAARGLLRRLSEAQADGVLASAGREAGQDELVARLAGAGLVRREVQVSCRKDGRSLFRLPSPEALAMVTASNAVCSECGAAVADERAEELVTPTPLASSMLRDGGWLVNSVRAALGALGLPSGAVAARAADEEGEARLLADVCGEPFLFVLRDGDFTPAHARRALEGEAETQATRLVVVTAGRVHEEARARLREHARRRARSGVESEVIFIEGADAAAPELRGAVERVSREALARELFELDASAGLSLSQLLAARFRLLRRAGPLPDLAASAAGALAGSLREI